MAIYNSFIMNTHTHKIYRATLIKYLATFSLLKIYKKSKKSNKNKLNKSKIYKKTYQILSKAIFITRPKAILGPPHLLITGLKARGSL